MTDIKTVPPNRSDIVDAAISELKSAFIDVTLHAQTAFKLVAYIESLEAAVLAASAPAKTQFHAKPLDGWVVTTQVNGDLLIESPSGDSAGLFSDDLSPLGEVTRQLVQSLIFGNYAAPVDAQDAVDAKRYRWLRNNGFDAQGVVGNINSFSTWDDELDVAIEAALQASQSPQPQERDAS